MSCLRPSIAAPGDWYLVDAGPLTWVTARSERDAAELALLPEFGPSAVSPRALDADTGASPLFLAPGEITVYQLDEDGAPMAVFA